VESSVWPNAESCPQSHLSESLSSTNVVNVGLALRIGSSFPIEITLSADQEKDQECNTN